MTNEEAIKWCRDFQDNIVDVTDKLEDKHTMALKAVNKAIEALEKQIPKKPTNESPLFITEDSSITNVTNYFCPRCGKPVRVNSGSSNYGATVRLLHCECGQRIDWSDSDEQ